MVKEWDRVMEGSKLESQCGPKKKKKHLLSRKKFLIE